MIRFRAALLGVVIITIALFLILSLAFSAPQKQAEAELVVFGINTTEPEIVQKLHDQGFIRSKWAFDFALFVKGKGGKIELGGYRLSKSMNTWKLVDVIATKPAMKWLVIPEGLRKEEIGERLAEIFGWSEEDLEKWNAVYTKMKYDYVEGVYFPDTYLIPVEEGGLEIAQRMINRFNEKFAPYSDKFLERNVRWTTGLKIASIVQREAAGEEDMPLIAGILWNRLLEEKKLEVDATVQFARGKTDAGWWAPIKPEDKEIDSPYNTYKYEGLPPHPIANPGLAAIEAVMDSEETDCLFYLHDSDGQIHCAKTFEEHESNIDIYLR